MAPVAANGRLREARDRGEPEDRQVRRGTSANQLISKDPNPAKRQREATSAAGIVAVRDSKRRIPVRSFWTWKSAVTRRRWHKGLELDGATEVVCTAGCRSLAFAAHSATRWSPTCRTGGTPLEVGCATDPSNGQVLTVIPRPVSPLCRRSPQAFIGLCTDSGLTPCNEPLDTAINRLATGKESGGWSTTRHDRQGIRLP